MLTIVKFCSIVLPRMWPFWMRIPFYACENFVYLTKEKKIKYTCMRITFKKPPKWLYYQLISLINTPEITNIKSWISYYND